MKWNDEWESIRLYAMEWYSNAMIWYYTAMIWYLNVMLLLCYSVFFFLNMLELAVVFKDISKIRGNCVNIQYVVKHCFVCRHVHMILNKNNSIQKLKGVWKGVCYTQTTWLTDGHIQINIFTLVRVGDKNVKM